eukprot:6552827-Prymnesium_polylepis.3
MGAAPSMQKSFWQPNVKRTDLFRSARHSVPAIRRAAAPRAGPARVVAMVVWPAGAARRVLCSAHSRLGICAQT